MTGSRSPPGSAAFVALLAVAAVAAGALVFGEAPDRGPPTSRFASAGSSVLCSDLANPVASTDDGTEVRVDVTCQDELPDQASFQVVQDGTSTEVLRLTFGDDGSVTAETPYGERSLPHAERGDLAIVTSQADDEHAWVLTTSEADSSDPLDGDATEEEHCTPSEAVVCVDAQEGVRISLPGDDGGDGQIISIDDLVAVVEGAVPDDPTGSVGDVGAARVCTLGGSVVRDHAGDDPADDLQGNCLFALRQVNGTVDTATGIAQDRYEDVESVVFHEKSITVTRDGETILNVTIPNPEDVPNQKPAVTVYGQGPCAYVTDGVTVTMGGTDADPCGGDYEDVNITDPQGRTSATVERIASGSYRVRTPASSISVDAEAIRVLADPDDADAETAIELVDAAGETVVTVTLREPASRLLPNETEVHVAREVEDHTGVDLTKVVSDLLVIEDDDGDGEPERVAAFPGRAVGESPLHVDYDEGNWTAATPAGSATLSGAELAVSPDAADPGTLHVLLRDADANTLARLTLDADATPPTVSYSVDGVGDGTVAPPVAVEPGPTDPEAVTVFGPDGDTLLAYSEDGSEATLEVPPAGESHTVDRRTVRIEGHPIEDDEWTLIAQDPEGDDVLRHTVNRPNYEQHLREADHETPGDLSPVVGIVSQAPDETDDVEFLDHVADGESRHGDDQALDGTRWMSGLRPLTFEATFDDTVTYDRFYVRYAAQDQVPLDAPKVALDPREDGDEANRTGAVTLANRSASWDGKVLRFEVVAERSVGDGLVAYARVDNRTGEEPYAVRIDAQGPSASVASPSDPDGTTWLVSWEGADAGSGVSSFEVQVERDGGDWEHHAGPTTGRSVQFTGQADTPYRYRVRAIDGVGHAGSWSAPTTTEYQSPEPDPGGDGDEDAHTAGNTAPSVDLLSPSAGESLEGIVEVQWSADDPDGTAPAINVYVSSDGGTSWTRVRTTSDRAYWDTAEWPDGDSYQVRVVADDGSLTDETVVTGLEVDNPSTDTTSEPGGSGGADTGGADDGTDAGDGAAGDGTDDETSGQGADEGDGGFLGVPAPSVAAALGAAGAAALARRRRR